MSNITTQNRIARQLDGLVENTEGLSMLQHFDYPETWSYEGNAYLSSDAKFGKRCAYFPDTTSKAVVTNTTGMFSMSPFGNYEAECFVKHGYLSINYQDFSGLIYERNGDYYFYNGHTFRYFADNKVREAATAACEALGGHLATSTSAEKNEFLTSLVSNWTAIGGQKIDDAWSWVTGETWDYTNWGSNYPSNDENTLYLEMNSSGEWGNIFSYYALPYICEWDYEIADSIIDFGGLSLNLTYNGKLQLTSNAWNIEKTSDTGLTANEWHHILFRITGGYAYVFVDGVQLLRAGITSSSSIAPESVKLGGYVGYLDEFSFRHNAGTEPPTVPESAYEMGISSLERIPTVNAPVTRASWSAEGLPEGVTLSESGVLTGHPTTAGTYDSTVTVTTNWGTVTKVIRIVVE